MRNYNKETLPELFDEALSLKHGEREAFLAEISDSSPEVAAELQRLLEAAPSEAGMPHSLPGALVSHAVDPDDADLPKDIGGYRINSLLGVGGMGAVYLGYREDLGQRVALKVARGADPSGQRVEALNQEARILAGLNHPHIAKVLDWGVLDDGSRFVVTDYVEGRDIRRYCRERGLGLAERIRLFTQVVDALAYAHANLIIHRDIKPSNILVDNYGHVHVIDFGIARNLEEEGGYEQTINPPVTPEYASPEQLAGKPLTIHSDVYALGAVLFELLTGRRPFTREEKWQLTAQNAPPKASKAVQVQNSSPPGLSEPRALARQLKGDLDTILTKALSGHPEDRYATATGFRVDLQRFLERRPIEAQRLGPLYLLGKAISRNRAAAAATAAAVIALMSGITFGAIQWQRAVEEREQAIESRDRLRNYSNFLTGLMLQLDTFSGGDPNMTMEGFVDGAMERLKTTDSIDSESRAWFSINIGSIYDSWGRYDEAIEALDIGLRFADRSDDPNDDVSLLTEKALVLTSAWRYEQAIEVGREAIRLAESREETEWRAPYARMALAEGLFRAGRPREVRRVMQKVIDNPERSQVVKAFAAYIASKSMAEIHENERAREFLGMALPVYREKYGEESAQFVDANALAFMLNARQQPDESRDETVTRLIESFPEAYPEDHQRLGHVRAYIGEYHFLRGELGKALEYQRQALEMVTANQSVAFTEAMPIRFDLVRYLVYDGRPEEAALVLRGIEPDSGVPVPDHLRAERLILDGWLATLRGDYDEAPDAFRLAEELLSDTPYEHLKAELSHRKAQLAAARGEWGVCLEHSARAEDLARETIPKIWSLPDIYAALGERCRTWAASARPSSEPVFLLPDSLRDSPWAGEFRALKAPI